MIPLTVALVSFLLGFDVIADVEKYVYVYDHQGQLLTPKNAAVECPDPSEDTDICFE